MKLSRTLLSAAAATAATFALAASAQAALPAVVAPCMVTDINPTAQACLGFYGNQLLSGNPADTAVQIEALGILGFMWDGSSTIVADNQSGLGGSQLLTFATPLSGITYIGLHFGGGVSSPTPGSDSTAFYRLDAGTSLSSLGLKYGSSSDIKVYSTQVTAVPEPETYALMLAGLGVIGFMANRRRKQA